MFDQNLISKKFGQIGTDVTFNAFDGSSWFLTWRHSIPVRVDVRTVRGKERFEIAYDVSTRFGLSVIDIRPQERHLLLMVKLPVKNNRGDIIRDEKFKLLCGHDERHYFACGIPEDSGASTVEQAKRALLPSEFVETYQKKGGKAKRLLKRKNEAGFRQGEWLFLKDEAFTPENPLLIKRNDPISRGGGSKPHICEEVYASEGDNVYVHPKYAPYGVSQSEMSRINERLREKGVSREVHFEVRLRDAIVYARGAVRHPDHKTIHLPRWHRVCMNTEGRSKVSGLSAFLD